MKRFFLILGLMVVATVSICSFGARAQQLIFTANCNGDATHDTLWFTNAKTTVGSTNAATFILPYKLDPSQRCTVNTLVLTANLTLDNTYGSGIAVTSGQTLTVQGSRVNPIGRNMFFGPGSAVLTGAGYASDADTRFPTSGQKDALVGTNGTPSSSNKYVTDADTGTSGANKALRLDGSGKLPAVDGSQLTNINTNGATVINITASPYYAVGDNSTDNTAALNAAIAACNSAGGCRFYIPKGKFRHASALTPFTVPVIIYGDGGGKYDGGATAIAGALSQLISTSATANSITLADATGSGGSVIEDLAIVNAASTTPSNGAGIYIPTGYGGYHTRFNRITVSGFYVNLKLDTWAHSSLTSSFIHDPVLYGMQINNLLSGDDGDNVVDGNWFYAECHPATAAVYWQGGGGLIFTNNKINNFRPSGTCSEHFVNGLQAAITTTTSDFIVANNSIEATTAYGIRFELAAAVAFSHIQILGNQFSLNSATSSVYVTAAPSGTSLDSVIISNNIFKYNPGTAKAIGLEGVTNIKGVGNVNVNYAGMVNDFGSNGPIDIEGVGFTAPTLLNGWVNFGSGRTNAGYRIQNGMVQIQGDIKSGTTTGGTVLFALPAGYRPATDQRFVVSSNLAFCEIVVGSNGNVEIGGVASSVVLSLDGISFPAGQ